ncbi:MAG: complement resistance protein TraT [Geminicoccaceae bacterium]|nr:complement resistance protein TraT [Geminicoccaceae bacterium]
MSQTHRHRRTPALATLLLPLSLLAGCAATETAIAKRDLTVQTKMTDSIFLQPVRPSERTVFVEVRNTSDKPDFDIAGAIEQKLTASGYMLTSDPTVARFMLQANILQAGRSAQTAAERAYEGGFGSVLTGGALGAGVGYGIGKAGGADALLITLGALIGAGLATAADASVSDVTYSVITDIQVSERAAPGEIVSQSDIQDNDQGSTGTAYQSSATTTDWKRYRTRVVAVANQANLEWEEAAPQIVDGMTRSIAGIF